MRREGVECDTGPLFMVPSTMGSIVGFICRVNPFRTAVPFWGQTSQISSSFVPKRDHGSKGVKKFGITSGGGGD